MMLLSWHLIFLPHVMCNMQVTSQALGSDPATGGKGAEQAVDKVGNVATDERSSKVCALSLRVINTGVALR